MKTMKFMLFAVAAMAAASCVKENAPEGQNKAKAVEMEFTVGTETVKTQLNGENSGEIKWNSNDKIVIFDNAEIPLNDKHNNVFTNLSGATTSPILSGTVPEGSTEFYAYYPNRTNARMDGTVISGCYLAPAQSAVPKTFAVNTAVMMGKADADNHITFKNITSHIRFTVPEDMAADVKSITLMGNNNETLAGNYTVDWNGGEPVVTVTDPETYVRLSRTDNNIAAGNYYFTILPVCFENGFTIIISKKDGSQVAAKTTKKWDLSERNTILPMKALESSQFVEHMNYYVAYLDGHTINVGGYEINSTTHSGGVLVNDTYGNGNITKDGVYFVMPGTETAFGYTTVTDLAIIGADASQRVDITAPTNNVALKDNGNYFILANLKFESVPCMLTRVSGINYGTIVMKNCLFGNVAQQNLFNFDITIETVHAIETVNSFIFEDCECGFTTTEPTLLKSQGIAGSTFQTVRLHNNIFYAAENTTITKMRLIFFANSSTVGASVTKEYTITNNTFAGTGVCTSGICPFISADGAAINVSNNLFAVNVSNRDVNILTWQSGTTTSVTFADNYLYKTEPTDYILGVSNNTNDDTLPLLSKSPLNSSLWDPANGSFGAYTITPVEGAAPTVAVGAQRADMTAASANINSAASNYTTTDLGRL